MFLSGLLERGSNVLEKVGDFMLVPKFLIKLALPRSIDINSFLLEQFLDDTRNVEVR